MECWPFGRGGAKQTLFADGAYAGLKLRGALDKIGDWKLEIVERSDTAKGFEVLPRRWVVECTFAWLARCRRLARDWENPLLPPRPGFPSNISASSHGASQDTVMLYRFLSQTLNNS
jgi:transposase